MSRCAIRIALKRKHLNLDTQEAVEIRCFQLQKDNFKAQPNRYNNFFGFQCKIFVNQKFVVKFPKEKSAGGEYSPYKAVDITKFINGKTMTQDIEILMRPESIKQQYAILICKV
jgi:hypothetical protein